MKVFVSWSGEKSLAVANALREWLPFVINSVKPFVSSEDVFAGSRWQSEIAGELDDTNFGIVCVTQENQARPWINFEAGALAKAVDTSRVVPLAVDLKPSDIALPLGQFQAQPATEPGVRAMVVSINAACDTPLAEATLQKAVTKWWPDLEAQLQEIEKASVGSPPQAGRSERSLLEEILNTVRTLQPKPVIPRAAAVSPLGDDHPLLEELRGLLAVKGIKGNVFASDKARLAAVVVSKPSDLVTLKKEAEQMGAQYGASVIVMRRPEHLQDSDAEPPSS